MSIISFGLGGDATNMIINKFSLGFLGLDIIIEPPYIGSGGSAPMAPGEIQNFYTPIDQKIYDTHKKLVTIKFRLGTLESEGDFMLNPKPLNVLINVVNLINNTSNAISVSFKNIKYKIGNVTFKNISTKIASVTIKKLRLKD